MFRHVPGCSMFRVLSTAILSPPTRKKPLAPRVGCRGIKLPIWWNFENLNVTKNIIWHVNQSLLLTLLAYFLFPLQMSCKFNASSRPYLLQQKNVFARNYRFSGLVYITNEKFKTATMNGPFGFVFQEYSGREPTWLTSRHRFPKDPFSKRFLSILKSELEWTVGLTVKIRYVFKFLWRSADGISVIVRLTRISILKPISRKKTPEVVSVLQHIESFFPPLSFY